MILQKLPPEIVFEILKNLESSDLINFCRTNKRFKSVCTYYKQSLLKNSIINKFQINYKDPQNFIYVMNDVEYNESRSWRKILDLYFNLYKKTYINCSYKYITSMPKLPNTKLIGCYSTTFPSNCFSKFPHIKFTSLPLLEEDCKIPNFVCYT